MSHFAESTVEEAALGWFAGLGYAVLHGPDIAPGEPCAERASYAEVVLAGRLRAALARLNPSIPAARWRRPRAACCIPTAPIWSRTTAASIPTSPMASPSSTSARTAPSPGIRPN